MGVEIWGSARKEEIEKVKSIFVKMALGVTETTSGYI